MAKFIRLKESKAFLNLEYVSLVTEQEDGSVAVEIIDQDKTQVFSGNDAANILAALKAADRYNATMFLYHSFPRKPHQQNLEMGLKILDSILKRGLLITPKRKRHLLTTISRVACFCSSEFALRPWNAMNYRGIRNTSESSALNSNRPTYVLLVSCPLSILPHRYQTVNLSTELEDGCYVR